jgi:hypothetical protein
MNDGSMNKNILVLFWFMKVGFASCVAVLALSILCMGYYRFPLTLPTRDSPTDRILEPNARYIYGLEGFGYGKINNEGFQNTEDYFGQIIDILIMGSSHMESFQVPQDKTTVYLLNKLLDGDKFVYNIGAADHDFSISVKNMKNAIGKYKPQKYIIIETSSVKFDKKTLGDIVSGNMKWLFPESNISGTRAFLRTTFLKDILYIRLLLAQIQIHKNKGGSVVPIIEDPIDSAYLHDLDSVMQYIVKTCEQYNVQPVILYHPHLILQKDGSVLPDTDSAYLRTFSRSCVFNNIHFIDMTENFVEKYNEEHILPYGFFNTSVGQGHLNKIGHLIIAQKLYEEFKDAFDDIL